MGLGFFTALATPKSRPMLSGLCRSRGMRKGSPCCFLKPSFLQSAKTVDVPPEARFGDDPSALQEGEHIAGVVVHADAGFGFILTHKGKLFFSTAGCATAGKGSVVTCVAQQGAKGARANRVTVVAGGVAPPNSSVPDALVVQCRFETNFFKTGLLF